MHILVMERRSDVVTVRSQPDCDEALISAGSMSIRTDFRLASMALLISALTWAGEATRA